MTYYKLRLIIQFIITKFSCKDYKLNYLNQFICAHYFTELKIFLLRPSALRFELH